MSIDASLIRTVMARECDTVNEYLELAAKAESEEIRRLLLHIANEEKEHIALCGRTLARLDPEYARWVDKPHAPLDEHGHKIAEAAPSEAVSEPSSEPLVTPVHADQPGLPVSSPTASPRFTIGSLIRR